MIADQIPWPILCSVDGATGVMCLDSFFQISGKADIASPRISFAFDEVNIKHSYRSLRSANFVRLTGVSESNKPSVCTMFCTRRSGKLLHRWHPVEWGGISGVQGSSMQLSKANKNSSRIILICKNCEARQPAYVQAMTDRHGPDVEPTDALKAAPCFFFKTVGQFQVRQES